MNKTKKLSIPILFLLCLSFLAINVTPTNAQSTNLAPFPDDWVHDWSDYNGYAGEAVPSGNLQHELTDTHNGEYTIRYVPVVGEYGLDLNKFIYVTAGVTNLVMKCWIKMEGTHTVDYAGGRISFDYYTASHQRITDAHLQIEGTGYMTGATSDGYVHFGEDWTQVVLNMTIPQVVYADDDPNSGLNYGDPYVPDHLIIWCQVWSMYYPEGCYDGLFSGFELYLDPEQDPSPTLTPSPAPTQTPIATPEPSTSQFSIDLQAIVILIALVSLLIFMFVLIMGAVKDHKPQNLIVSIGCFILIVVTIYILIQTGIL